MPKGPGGNRNKNSVKVVKPPKDKDNRPEFATAGIDGLEDNDRSGPKLKLPDRSQAFSGKAKKEQLKLKKEIKRMEKERKLKAADEMDPSKDPFVVRDDYYYNSDDPEMNPAMFNQSAKLSKNAVGNNADGMTTSDDDDDDADEGAEPIAVGNLFLDPNSGLPILIGDTRGESQQSSPNNNNKKGQSGFGGRGGHQDPAVDQPQNQNNFSPTTNKKNIPRSKFAKESDEAVQAAKRIKYSILPDVVATGSAQHQHQQQLSAAGTVKASPAVHYGSWFDLLNSKKVSSAGAGVVAADEGNGKDLDMLKQMDDWPIWLDLPAFDDAALFDAYRFTVSAMRHPAPKPSLSLLSSDSAATAGSASEFIDINQFEQNLDVWKELDFTLRHSDVVLLMADARYPPFHVPFSLLRRLVVAHFVGSGSSGSSGSSDSGSSGATAAAGGGHNKPIVIALNKADLVPPTVLQQWIRWLEVVVEEVLSQAMMTPALSVGVAGASTGPPLLYPEVINGKNMGSLMRKTARKEENEEQAEKNEEPKKTLDVRTFFRVVPLCSAPFAFKDSGLTGGGGADGSKKKSQSHHGGEDGVENNFLSGTKRRKIQNVRQLKRDVVYGFRDASKKHQEDMDTTKKGKNKGKKNKGRQLNPAYGGVESDDGEDFFSSTDDDDDFQDEEEDTDAENTEENSSESDSDDTESDKSDDDYGRGGIRRRNKKQTKQQKRNEKKQENQNHSNKSKKSKAAAAATAAGEFLDEKKLRHEADQEAKKAAEIDAVRLKAGRDIDTLLETCRQLFIDFSASRGSSSTSTDTVTIGIVGHPNVGKSSLINAICGVKTVSVSPTPGHTKHMQTVNIAQEGLVLLDCPGLCFPVLRVPRPLQAVLGTHPIAQARAPMAGVAYIASRLPLPTIYNLKHPEEATGGTKSTKSSRAAAAIAGGGKKKKGKNLGLLEPLSDDDYRMGLGVPGRRVGEEPKWCALDLCEAYATKRGYFVKRGKGATDSHRAAIEILQDAYAGRLVLYFEAPPSLSPSACAVAVDGSGARRVSSSSEEEDVDAEDTASSSSKEEDEEDEEVEADEDEEGESGDGVVASKEGGRSNKSSTDVAAATSISTPAAAGGEGEWVNVELAKWIARNACRPVPRYLIAPTGAMSASLAQTKQLDD